MNTKIILLLAGTSLIVALTAGGLLLERAAPVQPVPVPSLQAAETKRPAGVAPISAEPVRAFTRGANSLPARRDHVFQTAPSRPAEAATVLKQMIRGPLLSREETLPDGTVAIVIEPKDMEPVFDAFIAVADRSPADAAGVLEDAPPEVGEFLLEDWILRATTLGPEEIKAFQDSLNHDDRSRLPWLMTEIWSASFGSDAAAAELSEIREILPESPEVMVARTANRAQGRRQESGR